MSAATTTEAADRKVRRLLERERRTGKPLDFRQGIACCRYMTWLTPQPSAAPTPSQYDLTPEIARNAAHALVLGFHPSDVTDAMVTRILEYLQAGQDVIVHANCDAVRRHVVRVVRLACEPARGQA